MTIKVYFPDGSTGDVARMQAEYGSGIGVLHSTAAHKYELQAINIMTSGEQNIRVMVSDRFGKPAVGVPVTYTFPDLNEPEPSLSPLSGPAAHWCPKGVTTKNRTGATGMVDFQIGPDSWIQHGKGPYSIFVISPDLDSDGLAYTGWKPYTNHEGPVELFFQEVNSGAEVPDNPTLPPLPPVVPSDTVLLSILSQLKRSADALETLASWFERLGHA